MVHKVAKITAVTVIILVSGALLTLGPEVYHYDVDFHLEGDDLMFTFDTNTTASSTAVLFSKGTDMTVEEVVALYDRGYASKNSDFLQTEMLDDINTYFPILSGISFRVADAAEVAELMSADPDGHTAVMILSGTLPEPIYDGSRSSPILGWLHNGGILVNVSGCLGKYVSHGPEPEDIEVVSGYGELFAEMPDDSFLDYGSRLFTDNGCNTDIRDSLNVYMNEYTYGINITGMADALNLGYMTEDGQSSATIYRSGSGMVFNFGSSLVNHVHFDYNIVKILASGMDYASAILDVYSGGPNGHGHFSVPAGRFSVYAYMGEPRAIYGCCYLG